MEKITTKSTSLHSAKTNEIVLRESATSRLIFQPVLVDNIKNKDASIDGQFLYQRKGKNDAWEPVEKINLAHLKKGEGVQLALKAGELLTLFNELVDLYTLYKQHGAQLGQATFTKSNPALAHLSEMPIDQLEAILHADAQLSGAILSKLLTWATSESDPAQLVNRLLELAPDSLKRLNTSANLQRLNSAVTLWTKHKNDANEDLWQTILTDNMAVLEQVFSWPVSIVEEKAYVGGKGVDNKGGGLVDYLVKNQLTNNVALIEIKTPSTLLLGTEYRAGLYKVSEDLNGGVMQVLNYKQQLLSSYMNMGTAELFETFDPKCLLIIGHAGKELNGTNKKKSFALFRNQLTDVEIVTFDEMVTKTRNLISVLESAE